MKLLRQKKIYGAILLGALSFFVAVNPCIAEEEKASISWHEWTDDLFARAQKEKKFVLLDLKAVWCHWCHVMDEKTYSDPEVIKWINRDYIAVRVDQDANPDLSIRYEEWGWPATIIFNSQGEEIVKRRGFMPPEVMVSMLEAIDQDPSPGPSVLPEVKIVPATTAALNFDQELALDIEHYSIYDNENDGWGMVYKLIDAYSLEYAILKGAYGDSVQEDRSKKTLRKAQLLMDKEWGGFFQYSDTLDWKSPHYEKIMSIQSQAIRMYALAYATWQNESYLDVAKKTADFILEFWTSEEGAFYTSQDADVDQKTNGKSFYALSADERKAFGTMPRIDRNIYARENGWMIESLVSLYDVSHDEKYLTNAKKATEWVMKHRSLQGGGYLHGAQDKRGPFLGDTLAMGRAFLKLYESTANRKWLAQSEASAHFIKDHFKANDGGYITSKILPESVGVFKSHVKQIEENVEMVRWTIRLFHYTGNKEYKEMAIHAMSYLASPDLLKSKRFLTGVLLADKELKSDPVHMTIVGEKGNAKARGLYQGALSYPGFYKRIEWLDHVEGPLPNPDVKYPKLTKPAAFVCANKVCSLPIFSPDKIAKAVERTLG